MYIYSPGRAPRTAYFSKLENILGSPSRVSTRLRRSARGHCARSAGVKRPPGARAQPPSTVPPERYPLGRERHRPGPPPRRAAAPAPPPAAGFPDAARARRAARSTWGRGRRPQRPHRPDPSFPACLFHKGSGAVRAGAPESAFSCSFLPALGELGEPKGECLCLMLRNRLCSAMGTVSNFLKNYFNQARQLPRWREGRQRQLGTGRNTPGLSCVCTPARV